MDKLIDLIKEKNNPTVVGLDPRLSYIPNEIRQKAIDRYSNTLKGVSYAFYLYNKEIIDIAKDIVPAVKLQAACYELYGAHGVYALEKTVEYAKSKGLYTIVDGKRNDIGSSMECYLNGYMGKTPLFEGYKKSPFDCDALTINGYMGSDCIKPFKDILKEGKDVFVLVKTSNPSSKDLQDKKLESKDSVFKEMAKLTKEWGEDLMEKYGYSRVGAVVGATFPKELKEIRKQFKEIFFLLPGYGVQGGGAKDIKPAFEYGVGGIINNSRAILCSWQKEDKLNYKDAIYKAITDMKEDILKEIKL